MTAPTDTGDLSATQRALAAALAGGGDAWPGDLLSSVVPGGSLDAAAALAVYRSGYLARLTEQLGETYATVWRALGDDGFFELCRDYIAGHPSSSYNLSDYGREFADFLASAPVTAEALFLPELARFELCFHDLFHAAGHRAMDSPSLAALGDLTGVRFRFGSAVRLVACERAVFDLFRHREESEPPDFEIERSQHVLLYKLDGEVLAREVDAATFVALEAMAEGLAIDEALECAADRDENFGPAEVARLFEMLARCGLVVSVER